MSPSALRALQLASGLSSGDFARRLGLSPRILRRLLAGEEAIRPETAARIAALFGAAEEANPYLPRDRWIVGEGPPPWRREYVVHMGTPRFVARVVALDALTGEPEPDEEPADILSGVVYQAADNLICEMQWIDPAPADPTLLAQLMDAAADQLEWDAA